MLKDFGTYCLENGSSMDKEDVLYRGNFLIGDIIFDDVNTCYLTGQTANSMLISIDFINHNDLYTMLIEKLGDMKIIDANQVLSQIMFNPVKIDLAPYNVILDYIEITGILGKKEISTMTGAGFYPIIATGIKFNA